MRCFDYVGPARGTLSTVSDSLSVAGTVVKDEQTIAVPTTTAGCTASSQVASASDSVRVPRVDLGLHTNVFYQVFLTCRTSGAPPATAQYGSAWDRYGAVTAGRAGSGSIAYGDTNSAHFGDVGTFAKPVVPNYVMYDLGQWAYNTGSPPTNLHVRAWGMTGGTQATYLDMIYLVPINNFGASDPGWNDADYALDFGFIPTSFNSDDTVDPDQDNDTTSAPWLGKFSVLAWTTPWNPSGLVDMQEDDDEATYWHANEGVYQTEPDKAYLAYVVGATHVDAATLIDEGFPAFVQASNWELLDTEFWQYTANDGYVVSGRHGTDTFNTYTGGSVVSQGWEPDNGGFLRCYIGAPSDAGDHAYVFFGRDAVNVALGDSLTDPRDHLPSIRINDGVIITASFRINALDTDTYVGAGVYKVVSGSGFITSTQAEIMVATDGDVTLEINQDLGDPHGQVGGTGTGTRLMDGPVSVGSGYTATDEWWIKVEKRGYFWRAKAWADGDTEPDWQAEGHEYLFRTDGLGFTSVAYPWDTNWGATGTTLRYDALAQNEHFAHVRTGIGPANTNQFTVDCLAVEIEHNSGSGTPDDVQTKVLRDDDTAVLDSTVTVPWGSHRWVTGPAIARHFGGAGNFDDNGFNIRVWKDSGFPDLTPAILGQVFERRSFLERKLPQIYRRVIPA